MICTNSAYLHMNFHPIIHFFLQQGNNNKDGKTQFPMLDVILLLLFTIPLSPPPKKLNSKCITQTLTFWHRTHPLPSCCPSRFVCLAIATHPSGLFFPAPPLSSMPDMHTMPTFQAPAHPLVVIFPHVSRGTSGAPTTSTNTSVSNTYPGSGPATTTATVPTKRPVIYCSQR